jgi:hypothetical protein
VNALLWVGIALSTVSFALLVLSHSFLLIDTNERVKRIEQALKGDPDE